MPDSADLVINATDVVVRRGNSLLLDHVDWQVELDERWVVLGPNGAGKTTLLNLAGGRMHPTSGTVRVLDEQLGKVDVSELRPRVGLTSASLALPPDERVLDVVVTAAWAVVGRWREEYDALDEDRAMELLDRFGVAALAKRRFGTLSEGERKRVQIARAMMTDPELLLLDEPAAGLDVGGRESLVRLLSELAADPDSPTLALVSHHVEEIPPGFTHGLLLSDGAVVSSGLLDDVLTSENLTKAFDIRLNVEKRDGRYAVRAV